MTDVSVHAPRRIQAQATSSGDRGGQSVAFSVVIPVFNEENAIAATLDTVREALRDQRQEFELVIVNDGSTDQTAEILKSYLLANPGCLVLVEHHVNAGYGAALKTGIRAASGDLIVIADADGTYPVERIPELVGTLVASKAAMVVGARVGDNVEYSKIRRIPKIFLRAYIEWIARSDVPDFNSGLRVFRREVAERFFGILPSGFSFTTTITLACITNQYPVIFVPIAYARRVGKSKIQPIRDTLRFGQLIVRTGMYFAPLRILGPVMTILFLMALVSLGIDVARGNLTDSTVLLFMIALNTGMFALLADMIDKRVPK